MKNSLEVISNQNIKDGIMLENPKNFDFCCHLQKLTNARICIGRAGNRFKTKTLLKFRADHAVAMDAVLSSVDERIIDELGFFKVQTMAKDKEEYIRRPDLGRMFSQEAAQKIKKECIPSPDVQIIAADGLSSYAINANLEDIYGILIDGLTDKGYTLGTPIFVKYSRVAAMDKISELLKAKVTIQLIGERPGLATGESMSCYMAYESSSQKPESQRTVISNIYRGGILPVEAGAQIVHLTEIFMREKKSGIELKL